MDDPWLWGQLGDSAHQALRGRYRRALATLVLATLALTGIWLLLSLLGALLHDLAGIDIGLGLLLLGPTVSIPLIWIIGCRVGLHGLWAWLIVAAGSLVLAVVLYLAAVVLFLVLVLGLS